VTEPGTWQDLHAQFVAALAKSNHEGTPAAWLHMWHVLARHSWVQSRLQQIAGGLLRRSQLPADLQADLVHDALVLLAAHLNRAPDLQYDRTRSPECFPAWMGMILKHNCQDAARSVRRHYRRTVQLPSRELADKGRGRRDEWVALSLELDEMPEPAGSILRLYAKGHALKHIAQLLGIPYWDVRRLFRDAVRQMRRDLRGS